MLKYCLRSMLINVHYKNKKAQLKLENIRARNLILNMSSLDILSMIYDALSVFDPGNSKKGLNIHLLFELSPRDVASVIGKKIPGRLEVDACDGKVLFKVLTRKGVTQFADIKNLESILAEIEIMRSKNSLKICYRGRIQEFLEIRNINNVTPSANTYVFTDEGMMSTGTMNELSTNSPIIKRVYIASHLFKRVILVEGASDEAILRAFAEKMGLINEGIVFIWLGGKDNVREIFRHHPLLKDNVVCILDNDYGNPSNSSFYIHVWSKGEIENYLLYPAAILRLLLDRGVYTTLGEVREKLLKFHDLKKGSLILKAVFGEYGLSYRKVRDGVKLAGCMDLGGIDDEVKHVLKFAYAQDL